ncbi:MAG: 2-oxoacid:acceptor oxidoreductase family protein [Holosporaceae bacterium]|jgi:pyruvate ferredoxin oxidoreductase gamma subunit|nr:2-oxoacid:acceptor oxidoreductase family protein [Holosporaceae bacterium]
MVMFQVRIHGRGGQGVVTAAETLSIAAFLENKHAQAFPSFGSERMGAPVLAFCRISDKEIRLREPILEPDALIVQDPTAIDLPRVFIDVVPGGFVLINSPVPLVYQQQNITMKCIDATRIAIEQIGRPIPNAVLLGGFSALTGVVKIDSVIEAIKTKFFGTIAEKNICAAKVAYEKIIEES